MVSLGSPVAVRAAGLMCPRVEVVATESVPVHRTPLVLATRRVRNLVDDVCVPGARERSRCGNPIRAEPRAKLQTTE